MSGASLVRPVTEVHRRRTDLVSATNVCRVQSLESLCSTHGVTVVGMAAVNVLDAPLRVVLYCRVSEDVRHGRSVSQQEQELRADCAERGWVVVAVVVDNDVSASTYSKKARKGWPEVPRMIRAGEADIIATWESNRAQRDLEKYVAVRRLCLDTGARWFYSGRLYGMSNWRDRRDTGRDAVDDEASSGQTSERIRRDMRSAALAGRPHGR